MPQQSQPTNGSKKNWRWHRVPRQPAGGMAPCPICRAVDVQGLDVVILEAGLPILGCWPCVFGLAADAGKAKAEARGLAQEWADQYGPGTVPGHVVQASELLWTPDRARERK